jgi:hypothetical protein
MNDFTDDEQRAAATAASVLRADPGLGPVEIRYIRPNDNIRDDRYIMLLFGGERAFLIDRLKGRTLSVPLDDGGLTGIDRLAKLQASAIAAATHERLRFLYVVKHD